MIVLGSDHGPTLCELIDPANLPKRYGGDLDWEFERSLDEDARRVIGEMPQGPAAFVDRYVCTTYNTNNLEKFFEPIFIPYPSMSSNTQP
jgi:hypothetical protein